LSSNYGFSGTSTGTIKIYKNSISNDNLVWSGADIVSGTSVSNQPIVVSWSNSSIDAGSTNTYIIVVEWAVYSGSGTPDWSISLTDLKIESGAATYNISQYQNLGELPITETR
jgi:hypothetical protein